jgi:hypothetical protein
MCVAACLPPLHARTAASCLCLLLLGPRAVVPGMLACLLRVEANMRDVREHGMEGTRNLYKTLSPIFRSSPTTRHKQNSNRPDICRVTTTSRDVDPAWILGFGCIGAC